MDKIYFINLDRRPDRYEHVLKQLHNNNIDYNKVERFKGIDGNEYEFTKEEKDMFNNSDFRTQSYAKKIMGNQLCHYYILKDMIKNNYKNIIIFQDDITLIDNFNDHLNNILENIPNDAEIINIAFHRFASFNKFIPWELNNKTYKNEMNKLNVNDYVCYLTDTTNPCSLGYIVTLKGAINLVNHFDKIGFLRATDWNYNDYLKSKNIFYGSRLVLGTGNPDFNSDIFT